MTILHSRALTGATLHQALTLADFREAVALLSAPHEYRVAQVTGSRCSTPDHDPYPLDPVFEARVFDPSRELRWLCTTGRQGRAVLLTEDETLLPDAFTEPVPPLVAADTLPAHYLLWGRPLPQSPDEGAGAWTTLHTPQIGTLHIPVPPPSPDRRLRITAREYVCVEPVHGNAHVAEERLLGIEPTEPVEPGEPTAPTAPTAPAAPAAANGARGPADSRRSGSGPGPSVPHVQEVPRHG